jgi:DNA-directed RNA polymerase I, II, and III subunit RPABC2
MSSKKQLKKKNALIKTESDSDSDDDSETEVEEIETIIPEEGVIDEEDDNGEKDYDDYAEGDGVDGEEVSSNADLKENVEEVECYFEYDNVISEYEELGSPTQVPDDERITLSKLTKYEMVRVLGIRAQQISVGAKTLVKNIEGKSPVEIAIYELKNKMTPFKIRRPLPNNTYEIWKIKELDVDLPDNEEKDLTNSFN